MLQIKSNFNDTTEQWEIQLTGELDVATSAEFRNALDVAYGQRPSNMVLELDQLSYIDSTGLGIIIGAYGKMKDQKHTIRLIHPRQNVQKLLRITQLDKLLLEEN